MDSHHRLTTSTLLRVICSPPCRRLASSPPEMEGINPLTPSSLLLHSCSLSSPLLLILSSYLLIDCCSHYTRCGRTDKGVSAFGQVIALHLRSNLTSVQPPPLLLSSYALLYPLLSSSFLLSLIYIYKWINIHYYLN